MCFSLYSIHWSFMQATRKTAQQEVSHPAILIYIYIIMFIISYINNIKGGIWGQRFRSQKHHSRRLILSRSPTSTAPSQKCCPKANCTKNTYFYGCLRYYKYISFALGNERWQRNGIVTMIIHRTCLLHHALPQPPSTAWCCMSEIVNKCICVWMYYMYICCSHPFCFFNGTWTLPRCSPTMAN